MRSETPSAFATPGVVVQKYGGSSVASVAGLKRVAQRVVDTARMGKKVCVVVSAMGDKTDELLDLARQVTPAPDRRELDMLLSCGERISMALLSMAITELGHQAISFTGSQSGIITNHRHSGARILEVRPVRIQDELEAGRIVIVAGFQGVSYKREITTLGRGGSDVTAVAVAAALGAEYCEICSDVAGVFTADPRVVTGAQLLDAITADSMLELADAGAKVLHPEAVLFARRYGITLYARATGQKPDVEGGTRIGGPPGDRRASGVTGRRELVRIRVPAGIAADALVGLAEAEGLALAEWLVVDADSAMVLCLDDVPDWARVQARIMAVVPAARIDDQVASASVVGDRVGQSPGEVLAALAAARRAGAPVHGQRVTPHRITLYTAPASLDALVRTLHQEFIG